MRYGNNAIKLRSDEDGSRITAVQDGRIPMQQPRLIKISGPTYENYRRARAKGSLAES